MVCLLLSHNLQLIQMGVKNSGLPPQGIWIFNLGSKFPLILYIMSYGFPLRSFSLYSSLGHFAVLYIEVVVNLSNRSVISYHFVSHPMSSRLAQRIPVPDLHGSGSSWIWMSWWYWIRPSNRRAGSSCVYILTWNKFVSLVTL